MQKILQPASIITNPSFFEWVAFVEAVFLCLFYQTNIEAL